jgi:UDP-N-acetylmuramate dehydrogenase
MSIQVKIQKNIPLAKYTTFKIGGPAKYFCVAEDSDEIREALEFACKNSLEIFILGGGSNLLISDEGFNGLAIRITNYELRIMNNEIFVGSGLSLVKLVNESVKNNLTGLEWAAGIPGTVGGAIVNNAGANGKSMSDVVERIEILDIPSTRDWIEDKKIENWKLVLDSDRGLEIRELNNKECGFSYRDSIFKKKKRYIIINAVLKLNKGDQEEGRNI